MAVILYGGHFEDVRQPKFSNNHLLCDLLAYIYQNKQQTFWPRSCRVNQNFDVS